MPHPRLGEDIWAAVQLVPEAQVEEEELRAHLVTRITKFKLPTRIVVLDAMPKNATGKIQKREVKEIFARLVSVEAANP